MSDSNPIAGPSGGFLDFLSSTPNPPSNTPNLLEPTPAPLRSTDKNYYRSLFGGISQTSAPPVSTPQPVPEEPKPEPPQNNSFSFPSFSESNYTHQGSPNTTNGIPMSFQNPSSSSNQTGGSSMFQFPNFTASPTSMQTAPIPNNSPPTSYISNPTGNQYSGQNSGVSNDLFSAFGNFTSVPSQNEQTGSVGMSNNSFGLFGDPIQPNQPNNVPKHSPNTSPYGSFEPSFPESKPNITNQKSPYGSFEPFSTEIKPTTISPQGSFGSSFPESQSNVTNQQSSTSPFEFPAFTNTHPSSNVSEQQSTQGPSTDLFSSFSQNTPSIPIQPTKTTTQNSYASFNPSDNDTPSTTDIAPLMNIFQKLVESERYTEARDCKRHIDALKQINQQKPILQQAQMTQDFVRSLEVRQNIEKLNTNLVSSDIISSWRSPSTIKTFIQMQREIEAKSGKEQAYAFHREYNAEISKALQKGDLTRLIQLKADAENKIHSYQTGIPVIKPEIIERWEQLIKKCILELQKGQEDLKIVSKGLQEANILGEKENHKVFQSPRLVSFTNGIAEVYRLIKRTQNAVKYYSQNQGLSTLQFSKYWQQADTLWNELCTFMKNMASIDLNGNNINVPSVVVDNFKNGTCNLCMLPLEGDPSLKWSSANYHASCANFYCNRISTNPPHL